MDYIKQLEGCKADHTDSILTLLPNILVIDSAPPLSGPRKTER